MSRSRLAIVSLLLSSPASLAYAESTDDDAGGAVAARAVAADDAFTPGLTRSSGQGQAVTTATMSFNGAAHTSTLDLNGEVQIFGPVRLVLRVDNVFEKARPGIGAAVQWLDERKHGVASSAYLSYKTEGFSELEGEIEALVSFGKQIGGVHGTLNLAYGQDPEGRERDGEAALGLHIEPVHGLFTGLVGRYRDALGSDGDKATGILRDALGGVSATYAIGRFGVTGTAGIAGIETTTSGSFQTGAEAAFSIGAVF